jgi:hypothetical protein
LSRAASKAQPQTSLVIVANARGKAAAGALLSGTIHIATGSS